MLNVEEVWVLYNVYSFLLITRNREQILGNWKSRINFIAYLNFTVVKPRQSLVTVRFYFASADSPDISNPPHCRVKGSLPRVIYVTRNSILAEYNQQETMFHNLFISVRRSTCLTQFIRPSSGAQNCTYSVRYLSDQYLTLYVQFWAPDGGRKTPFVICTASYRNK